MISGVLMQLFGAFFFLGIYNFGGGYAMVPLIISTVVEAHRWISLQDFVSFLTVSQVTPGPIAINLATFIGFQVGGGLLGALIATLAVVLPSFIIISILVGLSNHSRFGSYLKDFFVGIRPVIIGLIATSCIAVVDTGFFTPYGLICFVICFYLACIKRVHPMLVIFGAGLIGMFFV